MKSTRIISMALLLTLGIFSLSCDENSSEEEQTCGNSANMTWDNLHATFQDFSLGNAQFKLVLNATNICIYENAEVTIHVGETSTSSIVGLSAFVNFPNSTPPDFIFVHQPVTPALWSSKPYSLNLRQEFQSNPGNFTITIFIYIPAATMAEAQQKYDQSVDVARSYVDVLYYRPK